ncbi:helix-turn-helix transcriptional regulator [Nonomuraea sp. MG754425]|uniref:winged helix-turn-helix domain-containing protein n=1 Tax=Nonomuraea sp. MG754425 TaxID=2570319 RepID=UPI001F21FE2E|nr:helix-turn-helix domain-containing protein [Nonomuraea sp. MG754425]MCF6472308.1 helix-turn-helix transcriptional regulator [Nonomuraea sp. MG754425]
MEEHYKISDPRVLRAVTHPLRARLLGLLRSDGPATASELGRTVGESSGSTSYHLRELFKHGFIEEDPEQRDGRERRWRARHRYTSWNSREMYVTPEGREAVKVMRLHQADVFGRSVEEFDESEWSPEWVEAAGVSDHIVELPPAALAEFAARTEELLAELAARHQGSGDARLVHVWVAGFPRRRMERS